MNDSNGKLYTPANDPEVRAMVEQGRALGYGHSDEPRAEDGPLPPIDWDELKGDPPPRTWWIQDWLGPWPSLTAGAGGVGKSRLWQTICTSLVTGSPFLETAVKGMRTLTWSCEEDTNEIWRNQAAINAHFKITMADLMGLHIVPRLGQDNTLLAPIYGVPTLTPNFDELREQVNDLKADVLVLDNISQIYGGLPNDPHQVTAFVNALAGLVQGRPFAPVLLGHIAKAQGSEYSGTMAWENAVRMRWYLGRNLPDVKDAYDDVDPDVVYLAKRKANYTGKDWRRLKFQGGILVPEVQTEGGRFDKAFREEAADRVVYGAIVKLKAMGVVVTDGKTSGDYLPKQIIEKRLAENHSKQELTDSMHRLMTTGRIKRDKIGTYANRSTPRYGLVIP